MNEAPAMVYLFTVQEIFFYMMFRLKYIEDDKCLACISCDMSLLYRFHFFNLLFQIFVLLIDCIDIGASVH